MQNEAILHKSGELPSRAPHTAYCNCLCSNNVRWQLPQSLPGQCSHIKFLHFIGINRYFVVSRMVFYYIIVTFLSNTRCKYRFRVSSIVLSVSFRYPGSVSGNIDTGSDRKTICSPSPACIYSVDQPAQGKKKIFSQLESNDSIWHCRNLQTLVQVMACYLFGTKPLPEPMLNYCQLEPTKQNSVKL